MKSFISHPILSKYYPYAFYACCVLCIVLAWWGIGAESGTLGGRRPAVQLFKLVADATVIMLPYWFLGRRWRWIVLVIAGAVCLWNVASICYYRFWGDLMSFNSLLLVSNVDSMLFDSFVGLLRWRDALPLAFLCCVAVAYLTLFRRSLSRRQFTRRIRIIAASATLAMFLTAQFFCSLTLYKTHVDLYGESSFRADTYKRLSDDIFSVGCDLAVNNHVVHQIKSVVNLAQCLRLRKELSSAEKSEIESFISQSAAADTASQVNRNQLHNSGKNLILIVVESLNAEAVHAAISGRAVAPTLRNLIDDDGTISALDVISQIRGGGSGDGQLLINTGLHPIHQQSTAIAFGSVNHFLALPRMLRGYASEVVFADNAKSWNEYSTFSNYGFDRVHSNLDYPEKVERFGSDGAMFAYADSLVATLKEPFFLELLTLSMHTPFDDKTIPAECRAKWLAYEGAGDSPSGKYLLMVNYFDSMLAGFLDSLKAKGLYDNTVVVIVSDHAQTLATSNSGANLSQVPMAFIAANAGQKIEIGRTVGQIDVFPTILDIMGLYSEEDWHGVGNSMLDPDLNSAVVNGAEVIGDAKGRYVERQKRAFDISELILRGDYFAPKAQCPSASE